MKVLSVLGKKGQKVKLKVIGARKKQEQTWLREKMDKDGYFQLINPNSGNILTSQGLKKKPSAIGNLFINLRFHSVHYHSMRYQDHLPHLQLWKMSIKYP